MLKPFLLFLIATLPLFSSLLPQKVVICGVCQNTEIPLPYTLQIIEQIGALFADYRVVVYENNSTDQTPLLLKQWASKNPHVSITTENIPHAELALQIVNYNEDGSFYRPELIARARNIVLDQAMSDSYAEFPYLIWMDMDFKLTPRLEGMIEAFQTDREWDAIFAYGIDPPGTFWDWYAFRDQNFPLGSELLGNHWWYMPKRCTLTPADDWYPVYSAFGGCGIYKKASIVGCRYAAIITEDLEHVAKEQIQQGMKTQHPQIATYLHKNQEIRSTHFIDRPTSELPFITDPAIGIHRTQGAEALIWRMSSFVYQYPSVCEHVTFHASMIKKGHTKLFIHPRLIFIYGG